MKKIIALTLVITTVLALILCFIPKHEIPTDAEWDAWLEYIEYEEQFYRDRDAGLFN